MSELEQAQESLDLGVESSWHAPAGAAPTTEDLARELGMPVAEFVDVFGAGWQAFPVLVADVDVDPTGSREPAESWHVTGEPYQLALRPQDGGVELGLPIGQWVGSGTLHWQVDERQHVSGGPDHADAARAAIAELLRTRRRTFRFCRYCRNQMAPEQLLNPDTCYDCGTDWLGEGY